jgi:hypothetical protein
MKVTIVTLTRSKMNPMVGVIPGWLTLEEKEKFIGRISQQEDLELSFCETKLTNPRLGTKVLTGEKYDEFHLLHFHNQNGTYFFNSRGWRD